MAYSKCLPPRANPITAKALKASFSFLNAASAHHVQEYPELLFQAHPLLMTNSQVFSQVSAHRILLDPVYKEDKMMNSTSSLKYKFGEIHVHKLRVWKSDRIL